MPVSAGIIIAGNEFESPKSSKRKFFTVDAKIFKIKQKKIY